jgi:hypothetical protein
MKHLFRGTCPSLMVCHYPSTEYVSSHVELAHNLESAHNSRHEFHFSSIAETYMVQLSALLRQ